MSRSGVEEVAKQVSQKLTASLFASSDASDEGTAFAERNGNKSISLSFLLAIRDVIIKSVREHSLLESLSVDMVVNKIIIPAAKASSQMGADKFNLFDAIPYKYKGDGAAAEWYVSFDKQSSFLSFVSALSMSLPVSSLLWIDMIVLGARGPIGNKPNISCDSTESIQASMIKGTVLVLNKAPCNVITKTWNLFEAYTAIRQQQSTFCVAIPEGMGYQDIFSLFDSFKSIDVSKSNPDGRTSERQEVMGRVRQTWGLARALKEYPEHLRKALFVRLRWKGHQPEDIANMACLLAHHEELLQLQLYLSNADMGKIVDGDVMKTIFEMYDTDNSGSIDLDELIAGLTNAGYTETECIEFFHEIDVDDSGFITFAEFECWFESQKKGGQLGDKNVVEEMVNQKKMDVSFQGLLTELEVVIAFSGRNKLDRHVEFLKSARSVIESKMRKAAWKTSKENKGLWMKLPSLPLKDLELHEAASKLAAKEYKSAAICLYNYLSKIPELIDLDPDSLQQPYPETAGATSKEFMQLSCVYLAALARILQFRELHHPLELEFCVYCIGELIEQWGLGVFRAFFQRSRSLLDGAKLSNHPLIDSDEKLALAQALTKIRGEDTSNHQTSKSGSEISIGSRYTESLSKILLTEPVGSIHDMRSRVLSKFGDDRGIAVPLKRSLSRSMSRCRSGSQRLQGAEGSFVRAASRSGGGEVLQSKLSMTDIGLPGSSTDPYSDDIDEDDGPSLLDMEGSRGFKQMTEVLKEDQPHRLSVARASKSSNGIRSLATRTSSTFSLRPSIAHDQIGDIAMGEEGLGSLGGRKKSIPFQALAEVDLAELLDRKMTTSKSLTRPLALEEPPGCSSSGPASPQERKKELKREAQGEAHNDLVSRIAVQLSGKAAFVKR